METIRGKVSRELGMYELQHLVSRYRRVLLDLGTGDGRYARELAQRNPGCFVIGVDACRENLERESRLVPPNALYVIASAHALPGELRGLVSAFAINFPWGSLLGGLLAQEPGVMGGLTSLAAPGASIELRLNGGALAEAGMTLERGAEQVRASLLAAGWLLEPPRQMDAAELRAFPSTWARRLAHGPDPRAVSLRGVLLN